MIPVEPSDEETQKAEDAMRLLIGETEVPVTWENNASVEALKELSPVTIQMSMYGGFEQVGSIGQSIVRNDVQTETSCGDIVLYSGNQIVIFYGSNSWTYTRLGHVDLSQQEMREMLGSGDVAITLE
ncbi:cyclophilin-like fold protein [Pseudoscardovia suis]|uniref:cyclophilin-like fold protein n=1 Tax=Pseudoscardovia suis TaxID=987063 RepID=UPI003F99B85C